MKQQIEQTPVSKHLKQIKKSEKVILIPTNENGKNNKKPKD